MPVDHTGILCKKSDLDAVRDFYVAALKPLGYEKLVEINDGTVIGMGANGKPDWWIGAVLDHAPNWGSHTAFTAPGKFK